MNTMYGALVVVILSNVVYHVSLKSLPSGADAILSTVIMYAVALAATLALYPFFANGVSVADEFRKINWVPYVIGVAIVGIEIGFLLAYRYGLNVSHGPVVTHTLVAILLVPFGILLFREKLTWINLAGIAMCVTGLLLIARK